MSGTDTILSYIGSVDTSSVSAGTVMFSVEFDAAIAVLMFEYKYQVSGVLIATPSNLYSGFIYPESAQPVQGSNNNYYLPLPIPSDLDPSIDYDVAVRVYDANDLGVTNWSNPLAVYFPPRRPIIAVNGAAYDRGVYPGTTTLYLNLDPTTLVAGNQYIVSYYYVPALSTDTHWVVTDLLSLVGSSTVLTVQMDGIVSSNPDYDEVYVAVNAVLAFEDASENVFYSVSEISNTATANQAEIEAPVITSIGYRVYNNYPEPGTVQIMDVNWTPPSSDYIPGFTVDTYTLYVIVNEAYPEIISATIPGNATTWGVDVSNTTTYPIDANLLFYLTATLESGTVTEPSNEFPKNIFYYADAPQELYYNWAVYEETDPSNNLIDVSFTFTNSPSTGSGTPLQYVWQIIKTAGSSSSLVTFNSIPYSATAFNYNAIATFVYDSAYTYTIKVFLQTDNTNDVPVSPLNGFSATSSTIIPSNVPFIYDVDDSASSLSFKVSSNVELNPSASIFFITQAPSAGQLAALPYSTTNYTSRVIEDGNYIYSFTGIVGFTFAAGKYTITASNQAGIGYKIINHV